MEALEFLIALFIVVTLPTQGNYRELISDYQDKAEVKGNWVMEVDEDPTHVRIAGMWVSKDLQFK